MLYFNPNIDSNKINIEDYVWSTQTIVKHVSARLNKDVVLPV